MDDIYSDILIENYKYPKNYGKLKEYNKCSVTNNESCGDSINLYLYVENDIVKRVGFEGSGCAISIATMSLLGEKILHMRVEEIKKMTDKDIFQMIGMKEESGRGKCAILSLDAVRESLK